MYDETGDLLCPTHANKKGTRYRYYISKRLMHPSDPSSGGWRLPAKELENTVVQAASAFLQDSLKITAGLQVNEMSPDRLRQVLHRGAAVGAELANGPPDRQQQMVSAMFARIIVSPGSLRIDINRVSFARVLDIEADTDLGHVAEPLQIVMPIELRRRGVEAKLVIRAEGLASPVPDQALISLLAEARRWVEDLAQGRARSVREIARRDGRDVGEVSRTLPLAFLAPDIVIAVLEGRQPVELTPRHLKRGVLAGSWKEQRQALGFRGVSDF